MHLNKDINYLFQHALVYEYRNERIVIVVCYLC